MEGAESQSEPRAQNRPYRCFLLRCWLEEGAGAGGEPAWRFTIHQVGPDAVRRSFVCLRDVTIYIDAELAACARAHKEE